MGRSRVLLALAALACFLPAPASAATTIPDVSSSFWAHSQIAWATSQGWVPLRANGTFAPKRDATRLNAANALELIGGYDVVLDGSDNFETRYLINDFAVSRGIPWIYGAAVAAYGLTMPVIPGRTACLRCVSRSVPQGSRPCASARW